MAGSIAQTIQGEAGSDPAAQFAVAATIYNRALAGTFPGGTSPTAIVNAPDQFTGGPIYSPSGQLLNPPNATANQFANAITAGTLPQFGTVGTATNFMQTGTTAIGNNPAAPVIGGNSFSDNLNNVGGVVGTPSASFVAPSYGGGANFTPPASTPDFFSTDVPGQAPPSTSAGNNPSTGLPVDQGGDGTSFTLDPNQNVNVGNANVGQLTDQQNLQNYGFFGVPTATGALGGVPDTSIAGLLGSGNSNAANFGFFGLPSDFLNTIGNGVGGGSTSPDQAPVSGGTSNFFTNAFNIIGNFAERFGLVLVGILLIGLALWGMIRHSEPYRGAVRAVRARA